MFNNLKFACYEYAQDLSLVTKEPEERRILKVCEDPRKENRPYFYASNHVSTTKYNLVTFFPKALFEQFSRLGNLYFLAVGILSFTDLSPIDPWSAVFPLCLVISISLTKEAREDYLRMVADNAVNQSNTKVFHEGRFQPVKWQSVRVGDVLKVDRNEYFPADMVFLWSTGAGSTCHVETMNLDGETNLKIKSALECSGSDVEEDVVKIQGELQCDPPNNALYSFTGKFKLTSPATDKLQPLDANNVLLRGCSLRNTAEVIGVVVYAGHDTKVMMNSSEAPTKRSDIERKLDYVIIFMFGLLFAMCISGAIVTAAWSFLYQEDMYYLEPNDIESQFDQNEPGVIFLSNFVTTFILYGYLIPISLYVSIEMVKVAQVYFMAADAQMYYKPKDMPCICRTSNLNEELGQVHTILSDKTGTLTRNEMELFKASIGGISYGSGVSEIERSEYRRFGREAELPKDEGAILPGMNLRDARLEDGKWLQEPNQEAMVDFMRLLALCNTVIPEVHSDGTPGFQAESPDELAFVVGAKYFGWSLEERGPATVTLSEPLGPNQTQTREYEILNILEFNSTRKRMSVIYKMKNDPVIWLYCKGADNVIYERLAEPATEAAEPSLFGAAPKPKPDIRMVTAEHMNAYSRNGLRTLALAKRQINPEEYAVWNKQFQVARTAMEDRGKKLQDVAELIEKDLELIGATAIEDKLQEGVGQTIAQLKAAGLRLWVLTGDKVETAVNIAMACLLLRENMLQHVVTMDELETFQSTSNSASVAQEYLSSKLHDVLRSIQETSEEEYPGGHALVIDGRALQVVFAESLADLLLEVGAKCKVVVACRVSPSQKANITAAVKDAGFKTLAIGDGANDVGMIQEADIGIGISGQEGQQAVMAADFAIAQFRFLERLVLHHGRLNYKRIGRMVSFFFYKNMVLGITLYAYNCVSFYSGQVMYNDLILAGYNVAFVALPIIVVGIWDVDVSPAASIAFPELYQQGLRNEYFNTKMVAGWMLNGIYQAFIIFYFAVQLYGLTTDNEDGTGLPWTRTALPCTVTACPSPSSSWHRPPDPPDPRDRGRSLFAEVICGIFQSNGGEASVWCLADACGSAPGLLSRALAPPSHAASAPSSSALSPTGDFGRRSTDLWATGTAVYLNIVLCVNFNLAMVVNYWTWITHLAVWGTVAFWFIFLFAYDHMLDLSGNEYKVFTEQLAPQDSFWLLTIVTVVTALLPDLCFRVGQRMYRWQDHHIVQEIQQGLIDRDYDFTEVKCCSTYDRKGTLRKRDVEEGGVMITRKLSSYLSMGRRQSSGQKNEYDGGYQTLDVPPVATEKLESSSESTLLGYLFPPRATEDEKAPILDAPAVPKKSEQ
ncbi:hypothetical protein CYMTET_49367 [Cymbomonas tetramitiformis]|uniref:Phospholipid-transporting ATPase n=1 Tax=Cymbomonas tetramitiformis TaxID=36881 RepID=A0AAE0BRN6_9CHLO|nr:hypothetical protein CYMTET_49367 [Cymbomonas tetramitiformis]